MILKLLSLNAESKKIGVKTTIFFAGWLFCAMIDLQIKNSNINKKAFFIWHYLQTNYNKIFIQMNQQRITIQHSKINDVYSHSMVAGGLLLISYTTLLIPFTLLMISFEIFARNSYGKCAQSAVMPSTLVTALKATVNS